MTADEITLLSELAAALSVAAISCMAVAIAWCWALDAWDELHR
jgi:hypothetical protein